MSVSQWYRILLEDRMTMVQEDSGVSRQLVPCRIEINFPQCDLDKSFLFKLVHCPEATQDTCLRLNLSLQDMNSLPVVLILAVVLSLIWRKKMERKKLDHLA